MARPAVVFFMGPPGAGKGTQAVAAASALGATVVTTSQVLAAMFEAGVPSADRIKASLERGVLAPPALFADALLRVVWQKLSNGTPVFIDGSPRTLKEAEMLIGSLENTGVRWLTVILDVPKPVTVHRVLNRWVCSTCRASVSAPEKPASCAQCGGPMVRRPDDTADTIERLWEQYEFRTAPVLEWMRRRNRVVSVHGDRPIPEVTRDVVAAIRGVVAP